MQCVGPLFPATFPPVHENELYRTAASKPLGIINIEVYICHLKDSSPYFYYVSERINQGLGTGGGQSTSPICMGSTWGWGSEWRMEGLLTEQTEPC